ncbi:MAG: SH3 domain-containing protein, partial [Proteobacteria bacterium]|nr:SH3 domain-containing protein [Pseudomonadota bacterium]
MTRVHALSALVVFLAACAPETGFLQAPGESAAPAAATAPAREAGGEDAQPWAFRITGLVWQAGRLRAGPGADHAAVGTVDANTPVTVLATRNTWYRVRLDRTGGPAEGWIRFDRVAVGSPVGGGPALAFSAVIVKTVNLRAGPSTSSAVAARLPGRTAVTILGRRENWYRVSAARDGVTM